MNDWPADATKSEIKDKGRIFGGDGLGLFGILKQDLSTYDKGSDKQLEKQDLKKVKVWFITQCGYARTMERNKKINGQETVTNDDLKTSISFTFVDGKDNDSEKLVPEDPSLFNDWFLKGYDNKKTTES